MLSPKWTSEAVSLGSIWQSLHSKYISFVNRIIVFKNTCDHPPTLNSRKPFSSEGERESTSNGIQLVLFNVYWDTGKRKLSFKNTLDESPYSFRQQPLSTWRKCFSIPVWVQFILLWFVSPKNETWAFNLSHVHPPKNFGLKPLSPKGKCFSIIDVIQLIFSWFTVSPNNENWGFNSSM